MAAVGEPSRALGAAAPGDAILKVRMLRTWVVDSDRGPASFGECAPETPTDTLLRLWCLEGGEGLVAFCPQCPPRRPVPGIYTWTMRTLGSLQNVNLGGGASGQEWSRHVC